MTVYNPEASTGFRLTNNSLAHASIDELKESASVHSKLHEPYHRVNLANTRGLGGMKKGPSQSSMSPKHSSRTNITQINAFHQGSGDLSVNQESSRFLTKRMTQPSIEHLERHNASNSNRFFDTFTKLQEINQHLELNNSPFRMQRNAHIFERSSP